MALVITVKINNKLIIIIIIIIIVMIIIIILMCLSNTLACRLEFRAGEMPHSRNAT